MLIGEWLVGRRESPQCGPKVPRPKVIQPTLLIPFFAGEFVQMHKIRSALVSEGLHRSHISLVVGDSPVFSSQDSRKPLVSRFQPE
jgi:hypothetical protein